MSELLDQALARAEATLTALRAMPVEETPPHVLQFGHDIGVIGRELAQHPELAETVRAFVERTAPFVRMETTLSIWINRVCDAAERQSSETEVYTGALAMRSDLEFFRELYRDSAAGDQVVGIETDETDAELKAWGREMYLEEVPAGIPASHVWWHQSLSGK